MGGIAAAFIKGIRNGILHEQKPQRVIWRDEPEGQTLAQGDEYSHPPTKLSDRTKGYYEREWIPFVIDLPGAYTRFLAQSPGS
jgi:hypothetical protein